MQLPPFAVGASPVESGTNNHVWFGFRAAPGWPKTRPRRSAGAYAFHLLNASLGDLGACLERLLLGAERWLVLGQRDEHTRNRRATGDRTNYALP